MCLGNCNIPRIDNVILVYHKNMLFFWESQTKRGCFGKKFKYFLSCEVNNGKSFISLDSFV